MHARDQPRCRRGAATLAPGFVFVEYIPWTHSPGAPSFPRVIHGSYEAAREVLAARIKQRRAELDLTQEALALDAEIDRTFVSQIERGVGNPSLRTLCKLADRLRIPVWALISA